MQYHSESSAYSGQLSSIGRAVNPRGGAVQPPSTGLAPSRWGQPAEQSSRPAGLTWGQIGGLLFVAGAAGLVLYAASKK